MRNLKTWSKRLVVAGLLSVGLSSSASAGEAVEWALVLSNTGTATKAKFALPARSQIDGVYIHYTGPDGRPVHTKITDQCPESEGPNTELMYNECLFTLGR